MIPFAAKMKSGQHALGVGLSTTDLARLRVGEGVEVTLENTGVGLWWRENDGARTFVQPRNVVLVVIPGDNKDDVFAYLKVGASRE